jgi:hypothetical protein
VTGQSSPITSKRIFVIEPDTVPIPHVKGRTQTVPYKLLSLFLYGQFPGQLSLSWKDRNQPNLTVRTTIGFLSIYLGTNQTKVRKYLLEMLQLKLVLHLEGNNGRLSMEIPNPLHKELEDYHE